MTFAARQRPSPRDLKPFGAGPVHCLDRALASNYAPLAAFLIAWLSLCVLALAQGLAVADEPHNAFLYNLVANARYGLAVPLFLIAERRYVPRLCELLSQFVDGGFVPVEHRARFDWISSVVERVLASPWTDVVFVAIAFGLSVGFEEWRSEAAISTWITPAVGGTASRSLAGWWEALVSQPLFLLLCLRSLVRVLLWAWTLLMVARLPLRLMPSHADLLGGLRFVTTSVYAFLPLALAIGLLGAARISERVVIEGMAAWSFRYYVLGTIIFAVLTFTGPLLVFQKHLWRLRERGIVGYGALATRVGRRFEERWLQSSKTITEEALGAPDFSSVTDLYSIVGNVKNCRLLVDASIILPLVLTVIVPFVPLLLVIAPMDEILGFAARILL